MTEKGRCDCRASERRDPARHPASGREPDFFLFSGAATLIQTCSQAGDAPEPALFLGLSSPAPAQFFGRQVSPPSAPTRWRGGGGMSRGASVIASRRLAA